MWKGLPAKTKKVEVRVSEEQWESIEKASAREGLSLSAFVRRAALALASKGGV